MSFLYSAKSNAFFISSLIKIYRENGTLPDDLVEMSDADYTEFFVNTAPVGKQRIAGRDGRPAWGDIPPLTADELISNAAAIQRGLKQQADNEIFWRQDAVDAGIATTEETAALSAWKKYRVLLMRVDTAKPMWPEIPAQEPLMEWRAQSYWLYQFGALIFHIPDGMRHGVPYKFIGQQNLVGETKAGCTKRYHGFVCS